MTREINEGERKGARQAWRTNRSIAPLIAQRWRIDVDAMALHRNAIVRRFIGPPGTKLGGCDGYTTECVAQDALAHRWAHFGTSIFVNPEFAIIARVVYRMIQAATEDGVDTLMLAPDNGDTKWYAALVDAGARVLRFRGRLPYDPDNDSISESSPGFPSALYELCAGARPRAPGAPVPTMVIDPNTCEVL